MSHGLEQEYAAWKRRSELDEGRLGGSSQISRCTAVIVASHASASVMRVRRWRLSLACSNYCIDRKDFINATLLSYLSYILHNGGVFFLADFKLMIQRKFHSKHTLLPSQIESCKDSGAKKRTVKNFRKGNEDVFVRPMSYYLSPLNLLQ